MAYFLLLCFYADNEPRSRKITLKFFLIFFWYKAVTMVIKQKKTEKQTQ